MAQSSKRLRVAVVAGERKLLISVQRLTKNRIIQVSIMVRCAGRIENQDIVNLPGRLLQMIEELWTCDTKCLKRGEVQ